ncbi:NAD-dependent succinate-semialdehyde dehydrogenase [Levilactobacillus suantsaii]|uniref:NAD-dependent succinate-semialdehyde dehydrogenase n=1 Tax=Levilactobacillus suantsaii TaxID=2292255 RepID=A0A4Q0VFU1_9LACO|nr:NAD-dependent succinate-semialdehyde dehydrogenase [Levilactobacillus suantsaii]QMU08966.1 NAD-dependent succinate-semialdehyde dehydrogenase [Levilactobacillus suantsaii]RXI77096.1 NAD-dependent succinate-semialdehyde dehydrogenase [Levilactobacillus suantsaii]
MAYQTINPYTNELVKEYPFATDDEIEEALSKTYALYKKWRNDPVSTRTPVLHKLAQILRDEKDHFAKIMTVDMGKLYVESQGEVLLCADIAEYYADHAEEFLRPRQIASIAGDAQLENHPLGVLLAVEPWNFPFYQIMRIFAPNFAIGDPIILKHAAITPGSALAFEDAVRRAGAPDGSLVNLFLNYDQVSDVIADKRLQGVALTGSERGGTSVASEAGKNLKKSTMELGGIDAFIVAHDADMDAVNDIAPRARLYNAGQVCTSSKRFIVTENHYDEFLAELKKSFAAVKLGDPMDPNTTLAPMNSKKAKEKLQKQVDDAVAGGATLAFEHDPVDSDGQFFLPTILTDIKKDNPMYGKEMFGPVAQVYKVKDDDEAVELANDADYGLGGIVFAGTAEHGAELASRIETGQVYVNTFFSSLPELEFGGVKNSGYGRELGQTGLTSFVNQELVVKRDKPNTNEFGGLVLPFHLHEN